jgi:ubiquitin-protein ligase
MHPSPRIRRLHSDRKALEQLQDDSTIFRFETTGEPADFYRLKFHGKGLARLAVDKPVQYQAVHEIHMRLGANYPRVMPELSWKTPIFHPNISASGFVCLGGYGTHWTPGVTLDELCCMLWDMIRYENFDVASPYNREAAGWVNEQVALRMPLDGRPLRDRVAAQAANSSFAKASPVGRAMRSDSSHTRSQSAPRPAPAGPRLDWHAPSSPLANVHTAVRQASNQASGSARAASPLVPPIASRPPVIADPGVMFLDDAVIDAECISAEQGRGSSDADILFIS